MLRSLFRIRVQLILGFVACFCGVTLFVGLSYRYFISIKGKLVSLNQADATLNLILEVRRYEKNYFLYRQEADFQETLAYMNQLERVIVPARVRIDATRGPLAEPRCGISPGSIDALCPSPMTSIGTAAERAKNTVWMMW